MNQNISPAGGADSVTAKIASFALRHRNAVLNWLKNDLGDSDWWRLNAPALTGGALYVLLIMGLWKAWIPYLSDICNPSTLAETGGLQWTVYTSWHTTVLVFFAASILLLKPTRNGAMMAVVAILLALVPVKLRGAIAYHIPWTWLVVPLLVFLWRYLLQILFLLNKEEIHRRERIADLARKQNLDAEEWEEGQTHLSENGILKISEDRIRAIRTRWGRSKADRTVTSWWGWLQQAGYNTYAFSMDLLITAPFRILLRCKTREQRFLLLFVMMTVLMSTPAWTTLFILHVKHGAWVNESLMALIGLLCLLGLLCLMLSLWQLGMLTGVRVYTLLWALLPLLVFVVSLFSLNPFEKGQATLNQPETGWLALSNTYDPKTDQQADEVWKRQNNKPFHLLSQGLSFTSVRNTEAAETNETTTTAAAAITRQEDAKRPLVLFCVSGGGTRAAVFAAGIYVRMWQQGAEGQALLEQVDAISAVSGGSLASAYLCESLSRHMDKNTADPTARHTALQAFFDSEVAKEARPAVTWYRESLLGSGPIPLQTLKGEFDKPEEDSRLKTFDTSPFLNAMRQNFVAPVVSGYFWPPEGRGPSYEDVWERLFHWYDGEWATRKTRRLSDLYTLEQQGKLPVLILNSLLTRTGSRIAFTNLDIDDFAPLDKFGPEVDRVGERQLKQPGGERFDPHPARILTMNYLAPKWDVPLKKAVRASANFPGALPLMRFRQQPDDDTKQGMVWEMQDGGGLDNYGTDSLMALLRRYSSEILQRGVVIFQIDASYLPVDQNSSPWLLHHAVEVKDALWRAGQNNETTLGSLYLRELSDLFHYNGDFLPVFAERNKKGNISVRAPGQKTRAADITESYCVGYRTDPDILKAASINSPGFAYFKVRLGETATDKVLTFWHLDDTERKKLYNGLCSFQQGVAIQEAGKWLTNKEYRLRR